MAVSVIQGVRTGSISLKTGITVSELSVVQSGNIVSISGYFSKSEGFGTSEVEIGTITGVDLPKNNKRFVVGAGTFAYYATESGYGIIDTQGLLSIKLNTSRPVVNICITFAI